MISNITFLVPRQTFITITGLSKTSKVALAVFTLLALGFVTLTLRKISIREVKSIPRTKPVKKVKDRINEVTPYKGKNHKLALDNTLELKVFIGIAKVSSSY
jgi:L-cystine uptake protein TcyP (sodium:dicarboxylate symporter family)